jgi:hypothetical protein
MKYCLPKPSISGACIQDDWQAGIIHRAVVIEDVEAPACIRLQGMLCGVPLELASLGLGWLSVDI